MHRERKAEGKIRGALVMQDGRLLVSAGSEVSAFDISGEHSVLHAFPGETIKTQPVPTAGGEILVATNKHVYVLAP